MDLYREATLWPRVRGERGVMGDGDGADDGQSEAVVVVDVGAVELLEGVEEAADLLGRDHRPGVRDGDNGLVALDPGGDLHKPRQMILRFARRYGITPEDIGTLVALLRARAEMVVVSGALHLCRDPDDDLVIETAVNGGADALVTRDDDLKAAPEIAAALSELGVAVLTVRGFLAALQSEPPS